jgi:hypothetical protein
LPRQSAERKPPLEPDAEATRKLAADRRAQQALVQRPGKFAAKRTRALEEAFLDGLREGWSVKKSAWAAEIETVSVYDWKNKSLATLRDDGTYVDDFALRWKRAYEDGCDVLEDAAHKRAVHGCERPVYQGGVLVGSVTEYSDTLLNLALRGKRPERYNTERHELSGPGGTPVAMKMEIEFIEAKGKK